MTASLTGSGVDRGWGLCYDIKYSWQPLIQSHVWKAQASDAGYRVSDDNPNHVWYDPGVISKRLLQVRETVTEEMPLNVLLFEVLTPPGIRVRVTRSYWELIVTLKHPVMAGREDDVKETLRNPDEVRQSKSDPNVCLFYRTERAGRWICAVIKRLDGDGYLITTYPTDAIKEGTRIWPR